MGKKARKHAVVSPTEHDLAIFTYVSQRGIATFSLIHRVFWEGKKPQTARGRLLQLVEAGYLTAEFVSAKNGEPTQIFWISNKAAKLFPSPIKAQLITKRPPSAEIAHHIKMGEVLYDLRNRLIAFTHEHDLKSHKAKAKDAERVLQIADGRVELAHDEASMLMGGKYLIEIDLGAYHGKMLAAKVKDLKASSERIIWLVETPRRKATVQKAIGNSRTIRVFLLSELLQSRED